MTRLSLAALLLLSLGAPAQAGKLRTSTASVLGGQIPQCAAVNYARKTLSVEMTMLCDGAAFLGPTLREIAPQGRDVIFGENTGPNRLCYCTLDFQGPSGAVRGVLQVFDAATNAVVERAEAR
jgi:hypothetical protein